MGRRERGGRGRSVPLFFFAARLCIRTLLPLFRTPNLPIRCMHQKPAPSHELVSAEVPSLQVPSEDRTPGSSPMQEPGVVKQNHVALLHLECHRELRTLQDVCKLREGPEHLQILAPRQRTMVEHNSLNPSRSSSSQHEHRRLLRAVHSSLRSEVIVSHLCCAENLKCLWIRLSYELRSSDTICELRTASLRISVIEAVEHLHEFGPKAVVG
mmetsp:Transcript_46128/g.90916  ORF Transcript_46128/g.90916 Transcript_46128/m.90916 type:complete len:212 (-) Transcript_46128:867-1502(-)